MANWFRAVAPIVVAPVVVAPIVVALIVSCISAVAAHASSEPDSAAISGKVLTAQSAALPKAQVFAIHRETNFGGIAETNDDGWFVIADLPFGDYTVRVERIGFTPRYLDVELGVEGRELSLTLERGADFTPQGGKPTPDNYATVAVFYGTDREALDSSGYGPRRGKLAFGVTEVSIPRNHRMGRLESPARWKLQFRPDPEKHVAVISVSPQSRAGFLAGVNAAIRNSESRSALVFVHGFNVTFADASRRTAQIAYDLGFDGAPMMYSWPSNGRTVDYVADGDNNAWSVPNALEFLRLIAAESGADTIHVIAHSMGNRLLTSALVELASVAGEDTLARINQVALVAPDIDADVFRRDIAPRILPVGSRVTLYASSRDKALLAAKALRRGYPRAGDLSDGVVVVRGLDTIDVSALDTGFIGHSYYAKNESVISDLFYLMRGIAPANRFRLQAETANGLPYWRFVP